MASFNRGENVELLLWVRDPDSGALSVPSTSVKLEVFKPDGTDYLVLTDMVNISTGYYGYSLATGSSDTVGKYQVKYTVNDGGIISILYDSFELGR